MHISQHFHRYTHFKGIVPFFHPTQCVFSILLHKVARFSTNAGAAPLMSLDPRAAAACSHNNTKVRMLPETMLPGSLKQDPSSTTASGTDNEEVLSCSSGMMKMALHSHSTDERRQSSLVADRMVDDDVPPPPPPPDEAFFNCPTPKINNFRKSTKRRHKLMMMLDDVECPIYSPSSSSYHHHIPTISSPSIDSVGSSHHEDEEEEHHVGHRKSLIVRSRRRPTPIFCPLDDPHWCPDHCGEDGSTTYNLLDEHRDESATVDDDSSLPPALPVRRNGMCPSNMPASIMVQMVIGR